MRASNMMSARAETIKYLGKNESQDIDMCLPEGIYNAGPRGQGGDTTRARGAALVSHEEGHRNEWAR